MAKLPPGLDDKTRALMAPHVPPDTAMLDEIGTILVGKRQKAVDARKASGIETIWHAAERAYAGIDDANQHLHGGSRWQKPMSPDGPLTKGTANDSIKSSIFVPITARYTDAGSAKLGEILVPIDGKAFGIEATPVPALIDLKDNNDPVISPTMGVPLTRPAKPEEIAGGQQPAPSGAPQAAVPAPAGPAPAGAAGPPPEAAPPEVALTHADLAKEQIEKATKKAKKTETRIHDWLAECQYGAQTRKVIFDAARLGVGVLKGPFPTATTSRAVTTNGDNIEFIIKEAISPASKWIDTWNAFPDPFCGENVRDGDFFFERDLLTESQVEALKKEPGYIKDQLDKVLKEGPNKAYTMSEDERPGALKKTEGRYEIWFFTGRLLREELDCLCHAGGKPLRDGEAMGESPSSVVTMINDTPVRAIPNPLESGSLGYSSMPWRRRVGSWAGVGIPEQMEAPQRIVNAGMRRLLDNAGLAAGSQIVMDPMAIEPADGVQSLTPNKIWHKSGEGAGLRIDQVFGVFNIPIFTEELLKIYQTGLQMAEESTSIPLVTQGQSGPTTPDTFGAAQLQNNNANQLLRSLGYTYDGAVTVPHIGDYYEWLLLDPNVKNDEKGDFKVIAKGSAVLVERAIADQTIAQMANVVKDPVYGGNPKKWFAEWLKSQRLDPSNFTNSADEQAKIDAAAAQAPSAPQIAVAQIKAQTDAANLKAEQQDNEADRALKEREIKVQSTVDLHGQQTQLDIAMLGYANAHKITIEQVRAKLAGDTMKLQTQVQLSQQSRQDNGRNGKRVQPQRPTPQVATPPTEPAGRAISGRAYEQ